jgi:hypothetical protein
VVRVRRIGQRVWCCRSGCCDGVVGGGQGDGPHGRARTGTDGTDERGCIDGGVSTVAIAFQVDRLGIDIRGYSERQLRTAHRRGLKHAAETWRKEYQPKHFGVQAGRAYGYAPRGRDYRRRQLHLKRGTLLWSGQLKNAVTHNQASVRAVDTGVRLRVRGLPEYIINGGGLLATQRDAALLRLEQAQLFERNPRKVAKLRKAWERLRQARVVAKYPDIRKELTVTLNYESEELATTYRMKTRDELEKIKGRRTRVRERA